MVHPDAESLRDREDVYQWHTGEIKSIPLATRELFEKYSGVSPERVVPHVSEVVCHHRPQLRKSPNLSALLHHACVVRGGGFPSG